MVQGPERSGPHTGGGLRTPICCEVICLSTALQKILVTLWCSANHLVLNSWFTKSFELIMNCSFIISYYYLTYIYTLFEQIMIEQFIIKLVAIQIDGHQKWERILVITVTDNSCCWVTRSSLLHHTRLMFPPTLGQMTCHPIKIWYQSLWSIIIDGLLW